MYYAHPHTQNPTNIKYHVFFYCLPRVKKRDTNPGRKLTGSGYTIFRPSRDLNPTCWIWVLNKRAKNHSNASKYYMIFNVFKCSRRTFSKANTRFKYVNQQKNNTQLVVEPTSFKEWLVWEHPRQRWKWTHNILYLKWICVTLREKTIYNINASWFSAHPFFGWDGWIVFSPLCILSTTEWGVIVRYNRSKKHRFFWAWLPTTCELGWTIPQTSTRHVCS